jgi:hypothetical protein
MNKKCSGIIGILLIIILGGMYKFIFQVNVTQSIDERSAIILNESERNLILTEMRDFLISVQQITKGITENDMELITKYAQKVGNIAQNAVPATLVDKFPIEFKKLGSDTHNKFSQLAMDAKDLEDGHYTLIQLSNLMQNCIACHAMYKIDISEK